VGARQPRVPAPPGAHLHPATARARRARPLRGRETAPGKAARGSGGRSPALNANGSSCIA
jgi:hypothetical protein